MLLAYFGPETFLPATSILAGAAGVVLMFGKHGLRFLQAGLAWLKSKQTGKASSRASNTISPAPPPHFDPGASALAKRRARMASRDYPGTGEDSSD